MISNYIKLYIRISLADSSNLNCESSELKTELTEPTPIEFANLSDSRIANCEFKSELIELRIR